jgi:hypothetical protein
MFSDYILKKARREFVEYVSRVLILEATDVALAQQKEHFLRFSEYSDNGIFVADPIKAKKEAHATIETLIGGRLDGAIALHHANMEMECLRYCVLAAGAIFSLIGYKQASRWCDEKNIELFLVRTQ